MKLYLIPIRSRAYAVRDIDGKTYGIVRRRPRKQLPYHLRAQRLHTLFPSRLHIRGTGDKVFQTLADVRTFITDHPEKYWRLYGKGTVEKQKAGIRQESANEASRRASPKKAGSAGPRTVKVKGGTVTRIAGGSGKSMATNLQSQYDAIAKGKPWSSLSKAAQSKIYKILKPHITAKVRAGDLIYELSSPQGTGKVKTKYGKPGGKAMKPVYAKNPPKNKSLLGKSGYYGSKKYKDEVKSIGSDLIKAARARAKKFGKDFPVPKEGVRGYKTALRRRDSFLETVSRVQKANPGMSDAKVMELAKKNTAGFKAAREKTKAEKEGGRASRGATKPTPPKKVPTKKATAIKAAADKRIAGRAKSPSLKAVTKRVEKAFEPYQGKDGKWHFTDPRSEAEQEAGKKKAAKKTATPKKKTPVTKKTSLLSRKTELVKKADAKPSARPKGDGLLRKPKKAPPKGLPLTKARAAQEAVGQVEVHDSKGKYLRTESADKSKPTPKPKAKPTPKPKPKRKPKPKGSKPKPKPISPSEKKLMSLLSDEAASLQKGGSSKPKPKRKPKPKGSKPKPKPRGSQWKWNKKDRTPSPKSESGRADANRRLAAKNAASSRAADAAKTAGKTGILKSIGGGALRVISKVLGPAAFGLFLNDLKNANPDDVKTPAEDLNPVDRAAGQGPVQTATGNLLPVDADVARQRIARDLGPDRAGTNVGDTSMPTLQSPGRPTPPLEADRPPPDVIEAAVKIASEFGPGSAAVPRSRPRPQVQRPQVQQRPVGVQTVAPTIASGPGAEFEDDDYNPEDAVGGVQTKGGFYEQFNRGSQTAQSFRDAFRLADAGSEFVWRGKRYVKNFRDKGKK